jgi:hypothetical protein
MHHVATFDELFVKKKGEKKTVEGAGRQIRQVESDDFSTFSYPKCDFTQCIQANSRMLPSNRLQSPHPKLLYTLHLCSSLYFI